MLREAWFKPYLTHSDAELRRRSVELLNVFQSVGLKGFAITG